MVALTGCIVQVAPNLVFEFPACFTYGDLIPDLHSQDETRSEYRLRTESVHLGYSVTHAQFRAYVAVGLLSRPDANGRWPAAAIETLVAIRGLSDAVRSLDRRLVRLADRHPVSTDALLQAMIEVTSTMKGRGRKLRILASAGRSPAISQLRRPPLPRVKEWVTLLSGADVKLVDAWRPGWYAMVREVIPAWYAPGPSPLAFIPFEEQVVLYAILDLSQRTGRFPVPG